MAPETKTKLLSVAGYACAFCGAVCAVAALTGNTAVPYEKYTFAALGFVAMGTIAWGALLKQEKLRKAAAYFTKENSR